MARCQVTGQELKATGKRGRPAEYVNDAARELQHRMSQIDRLLEELAPLMDAEHLKRWRADLWAKANLLNRRMMQIRAEEAASKAADAPQS